MSARALAAALPAAALLALAAPVAAQAPTVSERDAIEIAERDPKAVEARSEHPDLRPSADRADDGDWEVGFFADDEQLVKVVVDDDTGVVEESWSGHQVAWSMARGYEGAFGRKLNAPYIWLPLCAAFVLGLLDWRRLRRTAHLDLLVLVAGFGLSHYFFNRGEIGVSVPLAYLPLAYLLARMLWLGFRGGGGLRPSLPLTWLAVAAVFLLGFRVGLNIADSNVIDVGFSGVIGADLIADGEPLYGNFPDENGSGDTYAPFSYYAYVPFEQALTWSGSWDELPAAHGAAILFDLLTAAGLFLLGRRLRPGSRDQGNALGTTLAFAWAACPYSAYALESNTNDALVAVLLVAALLVLTSAPARGAMLALATATKFVPVLLAPLFATYRSGSGSSPATPIGPALRPVTLFALGFAVTAAAVMAQTLIDPGLGTFWERTVANQVDRESPFSIWGQEPSLEWLQTGLRAATVALALLVAFVPRRRDAVTVAALGAALLIAAELTVEHWFYLYIPWFLPLLLVALLGRGAGAEVDGFASSRAHRAPPGSVAR